MVSKLCKILQWIFIWTIYLVWIKWTNIKATEVGYIYDNSSSLDFDSANGNRYFIAKKKVFNGLELNKNLFQLKSHLLELDFWLIWSITTLLYNQKVWFCGFELTLAFEAFIWMNQTFKRSIYKKKFTSGINKLVKAEINLILPEINLETCFHIQKKNCSKINNVTDVLMVPVQFKVYLIRDFNRLAGKESYRFVKCQCYMFIVGWQICSELKRVTIYRLIL